MRQSRYRPGLALTGSVPMLYAVVALVFLGASDGEVSSGVFGVHPGDDGGHHRLIIFCLRDNQ